MRRWIPLTVWTLGLAACAGGSGNRPSGPNGEDTGVAATTPAALRAEAYGLCDGHTSATRDGVLFAEVTRTFNGDGDIAAEVWTGEQESTAVWTYGAPQERSSFTVDYVDDAFLDFESTFDWVDGRISELRYDGGIDGVTDEVETWTHDSLGRLMLNAYDSDGDGVFEDVTTYTWEPDGDGWHGIGAGVDPYGLYENELWMDGMAWTYRSEYLDDRGLFISAAFTGRTALGHVTHGEHLAQLPSTASLNIIEDRTFDVLGRTETYTVTTTDTPASGQAATSVVVYTYDYVCP